MNILLGFTPYVAFFAVMRLAPVAVAMGAAFAVAVFLALAGYRRGRAPKILELGALALFGALAVFTSIAHWRWTLMTVRLAVDLGLFAIILVSIAIGRPFTMQYARERVAPEYWQTPLFLAINRRIAWVWAAIFALHVIAHAATVAWLLPIWIDTGLSLLALAYGVIFTARYPERARKAAGLQRAA